MNEVIEQVLTDKSVRDPEAAQKLSLKVAEAASPWLN